MLNKWQYKLQIGDIEIKTPVRMECTMSWGVGTQGQSASFKLYNLSKGHREEIRYNPYLYQLGIVTPVNTSTQVKLFVAKDGQSFVKVFDGMILEAYSVEQGSSVGVETNITCTTLDVGCSRSRVTFAKGTSKREAIKTLVKDMPNVTLGNLGSIEGDFLTDTTCDGNTFEQIQKITGGNVFVDNGVLNVLPPNEGIESTLKTINTKNGLLGTPSWKGALLSFQCLFIPELRYNQHIKVESSLFPDFSGEYFVSGFTHTLVFSETEGGNKVTDVCCTKVSNAAGQDVSATLGTSKTDENYQTLTTNQTKNKVKGEDVTALDAEISGDIKSIQKELQLNKGKLIPKIKNKKITPNISWGEMLGFHRNTDADRAAISLSQLGQIVSIAQRLQKVHDTYFNDTPINITCGWRSARANNQTPGASSSSDHVKGGAIDFHCGAKTREIFYKAIEATKWGGRQYGFYAGDNFIHVGTTPGGRFYPK